MKTIALEFEKKLVIHKSPEEEICKNATKKYLCDRDELISQLYIELGKSGHARTKILIKTI